MPCIYEYTGVCNAGRLRKGMCEKHYRRAQAGNDPAKDPLDWHKYIEIQEDGCWKWIGKISPTGGYGIYRDRTAHRLIYEIERNVCVLIKYDLDHLCLFKLCVNPDHLEPVTREENLRRRLVIRTICYNKKHDVTLPNAYRPGHGFQCWECYKEKGARKNERLRNERQQNHNL